VRGVGELIPFMAMGFNYLALTPSDAIRADEDRTVQAFGEFSRLALSRH
jgi:hypothetical protein